MSVAIDNPRFDAGQISVAVFFVLGTLLFLPSINFSLMSAEIFPWGLLFFFFFGWKIDQFILLAALYLILVTVVAMLVVSQPIYLEAVRSLAAYLNCLLVFAAIIFSTRTDVRRLTAISNSIMIFLIVLGVLQILGLIQALDGVLKFLVPRGSSTSLDFMGGRGATLLASEPARAGIEFVSIYLVFRFSVIKGNQTAQLIGDILVGVFLFAVIRSAQCVMFYLLFIGVFYHVRLVKLIPVLLILAFVFFKTDMVDGRVAILIREIIEQGSIGDAFYLLSNTSGHRITSIISSYTYGFWHPFGGGVGNWMNSSVDALRQSGIQLNELRYFQLYGGGYAIPIRSSGFLSNLILDTGIVGLLVVLSCLVAALRRLNAFSRNALPLTIVFFAKIGLFGSVGNPVAWVAYALCLRLLQQHTSAANEKKRTHSEVRPIAT